MEDRLASEINFARCIRESRSKEWTSLGFLGRLSQFGFPMVEWILLVSFRMTLAKVDLCLGE